MPILKEGWVGGVSASNGVGKFGRHNQWSRTSYLIEGSIGIYYGHKRKKAYIQILSFFYLLSVVIFISNNIN